MISTDIVLSFTSFSPVAGRAAADQITDVSQTAPYIPYIVHYFFTRTLCGFCSALCREYRMPFGTQTELGTGGARSGAAEWELIHIYLKECVHHILPEE